MLSIGEALNLTETERNGVVLCQLPTNYAHSQSGRKAAIGRSVVYHTDQIGPLTLVGSSRIMWRMRAILLTGRVCASLYCSFTPLSPTGHIAHAVVSCSGVMLGRDSWVRSRGGIITFYLFFSFTSFSNSCHCSLYYCHLFSLTSISVIIYMCWPYESSIHATDWSVWFSDLLLVTAWKTVGKGDRDRYSLDNILGGIAVIFSLMVIRIRSKMIEFT